MRNKPSVDFCGYWQREYKYLKEMAFV